MLDCNRENSFLKGRLLKHMKFTFTILFFAFSFSLSAKSPYMFIASKKYQDCFLSNKHPAGNYSIENLQKLSKGNCETEAFPNDESSEPVIRLICKGLPSPHPSALVVFYAKTEDDCFILLKALNNLPASATGR